MSKRRVTSTTLFEARTPYCAKIKGFTLREDAISWFESPEAKRWPGCFIVDITTTTIINERTICAPATLRRA